MNNFDLSTVNLNLVPALSALLREASVGRAARRVGVSQSAMSHSLARLREVFDDPLLIAQGRRMALSPRAQQLAAELPAALDHLEQARRGPTSFDPATAEMTFRIATFDYFELTTLPWLIAYLAIHAPRVRLSVERFAAESGDALREGQIDLVLGGTGLISGAGVRSVELYRDPFKVIARTDHPGIARRLTLANYLAHDHVLVRLEGRTRGVVERVLARDGHTRRVGLWVPHFVSAPLAVATSDMISTRASSVAMRARELVGVRVMKPPIAIPPVPIVMWWPRAHDSDRARAWFRELFVSGAAVPPTIRALMHAR